MRTEIHIVAILAMATLATSAVAKAEAPSKLVAAAGGVLRLEGTSTLHPYASVAKDYRLTCRLKPPAGQGEATDAQSLVRAGQVEGCELVIPIAALRSGEDGLDKNLRNALKADRNPDITFEVTSIDLRAPVAPSLPAAGKLKGQLTVAGVERPAELDIDAKQAGTGLRITGSKQLLMSDFGVKAPVLMLGMLKTGDQVTIRFDLEIRPG